MLKGVPDSRPEMSLIPEGIHEARVIDILHDVSSREGNLSSRAQVKIKMPGGADPERRWLILSYKPGAAWRAKRHLLELAGQADFEKDPTEFDSVQEALRHWEEKIFASRYKVKVSHEPHWDDKNLPEADQRVIDRIDSLEKYAEDEPF